MKSPTAIGALDALAHEHRLALFRLLVKRGPAGLAAGAIAGRLGVAPSSLTFHLQALLRAGLVARRRAGRQLIYSADFAAVEALVAFLTDNCCAESGSCDGLCAPASGGRSRVA